ncbi:MAG: MotE family protein [Acetobacteraceae bacterium]
MLHRVSLPRLLPVTIIAMAALLGVKSVALVRAAAPAAQGAPAGAPAAAPAPVPPSPLPAACPPASAESPAERALLVDLRSRSAALQQRAAALDLRESVLKAAETKLAQRIAELTSLQNKLAAEHAASEQKDAAKWQALVALYQNMQPRSAAAIFDGLSMPVLLGVMSRMNERKAAPILAAMQPDKARELTAQLADLPLGGKGGGT